MRTASRARRLRAMVIQADVRWGIQCPLITLTFMHRQSCYVCHAIIISLVILI